MSTYYKSLDSYTQDACYWGIICFLEVNKIQAGLKNDAGDYNGGSLQL